MQRNRVDVALAPDVADDSVRTRRSTPQRRLSWTR
jgi:hypothetical protein